MIFSTRSVSDSCILLILVGVVSILLTYCNFRFSVSSSFIVISACSNLSTSFRKSKSGSRIEEGWMLSFLLLFSLIVVLRSSLRFLSSLCFYSRVYLVNMLFELVFRFLLLIA